MLVMKLVVVLLDEFVVGMMYGESLKIVQIICDIIWYSVVIVVEYDMDFICMIGDCVIVFE